MRLITVPGKVAIKDEKGVVVENMDLPFKQFLVRHLDVYVETKTVSQLRQAAKTIDVIEASNGNIMLEDEQYRLLKAACEKIGYPHGIARQLLSYYDAVENAEEVKK
jgi:hypothetical protein